MPPFKQIHDCLGCGKKFDDAKRRDLHRSNHPTCRRKYNDYLLKLPSTFDPPSQTNEQPLPAGSAINTPDSHSHDLDMHDASPDWAGDDANMDDISGDVALMEDINKASGSPILAGVGVPAGSAEAIEVEEVEEDNLSNCDNPDEEVLDDISDSGSDGGEESDTQSDIGQGTWQGFQAGMEEPAPKPTECTDVYPGAGRVVRPGEASGFSKILEEKKARGDNNLYYPFANKMEWELVAWLHRTGISTSEINQFIKLQYVQSRPLSFENGVKMRNLIEMLPAAGPAWMERTLTPKHGTPLEPVRLIYRDILKAIQHLLSRPSFAEHLEFAPRKVWKDDKREVRRYSEMSTGNYWWQLQASLPIGSTVVPVILGSDKTHLTRLAGDKKAWPVYLTIGNISSKVRNTPSNNAWMIIAYLPVVDFVEGVDNSTRNSTLINRLFHECMEYLVKPLIEPGTNGAEWSDSVGDVRRCYPFLAAYLGDHPEQVLITCAPQNVSPTTTAGAKELGDPTPRPPRTGDWIMSQIQKACRKTDPHNLDKYYTTALKFRLNTVYEPFWRDLPKFEPHLCVSPDILHGPVKFWRDHLLVWIQRLVGVDEFDARLRALQPVRGYRHFHRGVGHLTQWTGREDRELQRVTVAIAAGAPKVTEKVMQNIRAYHDFLYLIQYHSQLDSTLRYIKNALAAFHNTKDVYIEEKVRHGRKKTKQMKHFNIPKLAAFHSYAIHIPEMGSSPQFSTEITEYNHKFMAKTAYLATNRKDYGTQMCRFLDRTDRLLQVQEFAGWCRERAQKQWIDGMLEQFPGSPSYQNQIRMTVEGTQTREPTKEKGRDTARLWVTITPHAAQQRISLVSKEYQLPDLRDAIAAYLSSTARQQTSQINAELCRDALPKVNWIDVWKNLKIRTPDIQDEGQCSEPHTVEALPPSRDFPYGHCHCVLVHTSPAAKATRIEGYHVAQVRLFFRAHLEDVRHPAHSKPLAYVQFFTKPRQKPEKDIQMYSVSRPEREGEYRRGHIISIESISRFVQLIPSYGPGVSPELNAHTSMELTRDFHINSFADKQIHQCIW